ncbi:TPA: hypothetical protein ACK3Q6_004088 [Burkholderia cepacia]|uniref:Uncharacterized protein n=3 Tax=Burkholderia cepacia complex TaxID=87882 RepID=A0A250LKT8_9BURK|nr:MULTISPECIES: hypothetical protein [Burkholderia]KKL36502.1 hypothetical protein WR31_25310 [Burkholderia contaminans LMG 23361]MBA9864470.1 hypothetical protein [Burkholderia contaminans]MBA9906740.1 hypothetical protein [Burkholderia contaminans]MBA9929514.1 hypothetical protein [Burkholderia contaminans]MBX3822816.1 hypothetical protein [Burkholderia contaminans]
MNTDGMKLPRGVNARFISGMLECWQYQDHDASYHARWDSNVNGMRMVFGDYPPSLFSKDSGLNQHGHTIEQWLEIGRNIALGFFGAAEVVARARGVTGKK